jgi:hypothetical protein
MPAAALWAFSLCCEWLMSQQSFARRLPQGRPGLPGLGASSGWLARPGKLRATVLRPLMRQRWRSAVSPTDVASTKSASKALKKRWRRGRAFDIGTQKYTNQSACRVQQTAWLV